MDYFKDTTELRKLILDNPDLPLIIFCGEDCNSGEWAYEVLNGEKQY